jgi:AcrR family transcriptional regulator
VLPESINTTHKFIYIILNLIMAQLSSAARRRRGRPKGKRNLQRGRLLGAAREFLCRETPDALNLRRLAEAAGVTPALAHYYFGNRDGLIDALFAEQLVTVVEELLAASRARAHQPLQAITTLLQRTAALLASDALLRRCLWLALPAAITLRGQLRSCLRELLVRAQNSGALRSDLAADYLADSLLGLVLFHFLDERPNATGAEDVAELMLQHVALLRDGILGDRK